MSCGVGHRCVSDPALLWPWCRPADTAPIRPLAWELPYATGSSPRKRQKDKKKGCVRVPTVAQWVKNPTAASWVETEAWIQSLAWKLPYAVGVWP